MTSEETVAQNEDEPAEDGSPLSREILGRIAIAWNSRGIQPGPVEGKKWYNFRSILFFIQL